MCCCGLAASCLFYLLYDLWLNRGGAETFRTRVWALRKKRCYAPFSFPLFYNFPLRIFSPCWFDSSSAFRVPLTLALQLGSSRATTSTQEVFLYWLNEWLRNSNMLLWVFRRVFNFSLTEALFFTWRPCFFKRCYKDDYRVNKNTCNKATIYDIVYVTTNESHTKWIVSTLQIILNGKQGHWTWAGIAQSV